MRLMSEFELSNELKNAIEALLEMLEENGWELNDDGDIVEKKSKRLVWEIYNGRDRDE